MPNQVYEIDCRNQRQERSLDHLVQLSAVTDFFNKAFSCDFSAVEISLLKDLNVYCLFQETMQQQNRFNYLPFFIIYNLSHCSFTNPVTRSPHSGRMMEYQLPFQDIRNIFHIGKVLDCPVALQCFTGFHLPQQLLGYGHSFGIIQIYIAKPPQLLHCFTQD